MCECTTSNDCLDIQLSYFVMILWWWMIYRYMVTPLPRLSKMLKIDYSCNKVFDRVYFYLHIPNWNNYGSCRNRVSIYNSYFGYLKFFTQLTHLHRLWTSIAILLSWSIAHLRANVGLQQDFLKISSAM